MARIVAGGQTGADRAALDFALEAGIAYGGWCPRGGWAEDHPLPPGILTTYPALVETPSPDPDQRSRWNVRDSDVTLIVVGGHPTEKSPGTELTMAVAERLRRPWTVVWPGQSDRRQRIAALTASRSSNLVLNVAGPRESESPGLYRACLDLLRDAADLLV